MISKYHINIYLYLINRWIYIDIELKREETEKERKKKPGEKITKDKGKRVGADKD
jgi:hypothetical protein